MSECFICKEKSNFNGYVWLAEGKYEDLYLCRSHYMQWCKSEGCKKIKEKYRSAKPTTKEWHKKYHLLQKEFDKWMDKKFKK